MKHLLAIGLACLASCSGADQRPKDVLSHEQFKEVLMEAQMIEARLNHEMVIDKRADSPVRRYYQDMFAQHGVTEEEFQKTFQYYAERPDSLKVIYDEILVELAQKRDSVQ